MIKRCVRTRGPIFGQASMYSDQHSARRREQQIIDSMNNLQVPRITTDGQIQILSYVHNICNTIKSDIPGIALYKVINPSCIAEFTNNKKKAAKKIKMGVIKQLNACIKSDKHNLSGILGPWILTKCNNIFLKSLGIRPIRASEMKISEIKNCIWLPNFSRIWGFLYCLWYGKKQVQ